jgi:hypothetical protein
MNFSCLCDKEGEKKAIYCVLLFFVAEKRGEMEKVGYL